jgi:hypothetical protein
VAQQTINGGIFYPEMFAGQATGRLNGGNITISADTNEIAIVFDAPKTGNITGFSYNLSTNTATSVETRLESVTAGDPSGTLASANTNFTGTTGTGLKSIVLTSAYAATKGDRLAFVIQQHGAGSVVLLAYATASAGGVMNAGNTFPKKNVASWAAVGQTVGNLAVNYGGTYFYIPGLLCADSSGNNLTSIGNGNERGIQLTLPFPVTVGGFYFNGGPSAAGADGSVTLWDNAGTPVSLLTRTILAKDSASVAQGYGNLMLGMFPSIAGVALNGVVNLVVKQTGATGVSLNELILLDTATAAMAGMWSGGTTIKGITRASGVTTGFTVSNTRRPYGMGLILSGADDGTGGGAGGLLTHPGLAGGMRG